MTTKTTEKYRICGHVAHVVVDGRTYRWSAGDGPQPIVWVKDDDGYGQTFSLTADKKFATEFIERSVPPYGAIQQGVYQISSWAVEKEVTTTTVETETFAIWEVNARG